MVRPKNFPEVFNFRMPAGSRKRLKAVMKPDETQGAVLRANFLYLLITRESIKASTPKEPRRPR